ncbi:MAG: hypothetical protein KY475_13545 [Planctomycetes bacterium]|nr:hypothetical protein [Planctomycetota bacterium]
MCWIPLLCVSLFLADVEGRPTVIVVVGAAGAPEYGRQFETWAANVTEAAEAGNAEVIRIGLGEGGEGEASDRERLKNVLAEVPPDSPHPVWLVLIGHGAFDRRKATFNLDGPDVSTEELKEWLEPLDRPVAVVNCASASGTFLSALAGGNRVIVTATRSGAEQNFARFGEYFSAALSDSGADLDKDEQVSLLEAFLAASSRVEEFYKRENRLATEHSLIDDTGDGLGTPADWFRGIRAVKAAKDDAEIDGLRANQLHLISSDREELLTPEQRARRDELEAEIETLRRRKAELDGSQHYAALEPLMVELARIYAEAEQADAEDRN